MTIACPKPSDNDFFLPPREGLGQAVMFTLKSIEFLTKFAGSEQ